MRITNAGPGATARVRAALAAIEAADRPEIWITLRSADELLAKATVVDQAVAAGTDLPLAGLLLAVKNNVDTIFPAVPAPARPWRWPGLADIAIGTDTAGSGRIPAGFQGIVGIKPTLNVVSTAGVVPACRSWDAVTIFARDLATAELAMGIMAGGARPWPADARLAAPARPRVAYPSSLPELPPAWAAEFGCQIATLQAADIDTERIEFEVFLQAALLLYDGGLVAERYAAVGEFVDAAAGNTGNPAALDPTVAGIVRGAGQVPAHRYIADTARLDGLKRQAMARLEGSMPWSYPLRRSTRAWRTSLPTRQG